MSFRLLFVFVIAVALAPPILAQGDLPHRLDEGLTKAIVEGDAGKVETLLKQGADAESYAHNDVLSLTKTAPQISQLALASDGMGLRDSAAFFVAPVPTDNSAILELLVKYGANVNARTNEKKTALFYAVQSNSVKNVQWLLSHHADVNVAGAEGATPLLLAVNVFILQTRTATPMPHGATSADMIIRALLAAGANVNARDARGRTPLLEAIEHGAPQLVLLLLQNGADARGTDEEGTPIFFSAVARADQPILQQMLRRGANVNAADVRGRTALFLALTRGQSAVIQTLLDAGADVNEPTSDNKTPLMEAVESGDLSLVQLMLARGAEIKSAAGNRALVSSVTMLKNTEILKFLLAHGANANGNGVLERASQTAPVQSVALLIAAGANVNAVSVYGITPLLMVALSARKADTIKVLLQGGANANFQDEFGNTPLILAAANGYAENVQALLDSGADIHLKTKQGDTALTLAIKNDHPDVAALLHKAGV